MIGSCCQENTDNYNDNKEGRENDKMKDLYSGNQKTGRRYSYNSKRSSTVWSKGRLDEFDFVRAASFPVARDGELLVRQFDFTKSRSW